MCKGDYLTVTKFLPSILPWASDRQCPYSLSCDNLVEATDWSEFWLHRRNPRLLSTIQMLFSSTTFQPPRPMYTSNCSLFLLTTRVVIILPAYLLNALQGGRCLKEPEGFKPSPMCLNGLLLTEVRLPLRHDSFNLVGSERFELSRLSTARPKRAASTNFATSPHEVFIYCLNS